MTRADRRPKIVRRARKAFPSASKKTRRRRLREEKSSGAPSIVPTHHAGSESNSIWPITDAPREFWQVAAICITACVSLFLLQFVATERMYALFFPPDRGVLDTYWVLRVKAWWVAWALVSYLALPALVMIFSSGKRLRDCNLSWRGFQQHYWIYVGLYAAVFPVIWLVSLTPDFYSYYPMYAQAGRSWFDLLVWEGLYAGQFIALEFFFRGFLVGGLSRYIGIFAVPVSVMPYMMIHFAKPWPEAGASIVAGFVLGALAWKTKSIWGGVFVHCAVAITMDLLALSHKGQLPWLHS
ncbi:MAG: CPBP family intramembrane glutamic endopeptidase [Candidatus Acidiferrales bacterium]